MQSSCGLTARACILACVSEHGIGSEVARSGSAKWVCFVIGVLYRFVEIVMLLPKPTDGAESLLE